MGNMKDSGIEWIGQIPSSWEICRIKDKYQLITGFTPDTARDDFYDDENGYTWISIADMTKEGKNISESSAGISDIYIKSKHPEIVKKGSLLYSFKLSVGKVGFAQKELYTNEAIASFQENSDICLGYLYYAAFLIEENANINIYGAKILNQDLINNSVTIFPPLTEQQLIAEFLDDKVGKIDDILFDLRKQVEILQKYKKSVITKAVTKGLDSSVAMKDSGVEWIGEIPKHWIYKKLGYVSFITKLAGFEFTDYFDYEAGGNVIAIRGLNLKNFNIDTTDIQTITESVSDKLPRSQIKMGDILVSYAGSVGNIGLMQDDTKRYHLAPNVGKVEICEDNIHSKYVAYYLVSYSGQEEIDLLKNKNAQESISMENLRRVKILIPSIEEQQQIADYLDDKCTKIDELIKDKEAQVEKMEQYKNSLIYEYVTGKKRVKGAE